MKKVKPEIMSEVQKAAYLEAYMAQQAAALQQQQHSKFRYDSSPGPTTEEKKKGLANGHQGQGKGGSFNPGNNCGNYGSPLKVPQLQPSGGETFKSNLEATFTIPDDGLGYDDGVRVLRTLGSWTPEYPGLSSRSTTGMLFPEIPYSHADMSLNQRKVPTTVLSSPLPTPPHNTSLTRPTPTLPPMKKEDSSRSMSVSQTQQHINNQGSVSGSSSSHKVNGVTSTVQNSSKSFTCTICGKSLARKDKLVIHTRIHTGEKPYVCEVCDKAFARRDKLVIHMNKMKHRTPTNIAPLGKRSNSDKPPGPGPKKQQEESEEQHPKTSPICLQSAAANWSCELCGQMMTTREEWMIHAKAHLEEKITGIGVISPSNFPNNQRTIANYSGNSVHMPPIGNSSYNMPQHPGHYQAFSISERQYCPVCRQSFSTKSEFMLHVRAHFDSAIKPADGDPARPQTSSAPTIIDNSSTGICS